MGCEPAKRNPLTDPRRWAAQGVCATAVGFAYALFHRGRSSSLILVKIGAALVVLGAVAELAVRVRRRKSRPTSS